MGSTDLILTLLLSMNEAVASYEHECSVTNSSESCVRECCRASCCSIGEGCCQEDCCSKFQVDGGDWALQNSDLIGYIVICAFLVGSLIYYIYKHRHRPAVARLLRVIGLDRSTNGPTGHNQTNNISPLSGASGGVSRGFNTAFTNTGAHVQPSSYPSAGYPLASTNVSNTPYVDDDIPTVAPPSYSEATATR